MEEDAKPFRSTTKRLEKGATPKLLFGDWSRGDQISSAIAALALVASALAASYAYNQSERAESFAASDFLLTRYDSPDMQDARVILRWYDGYLRKQKWPRTEPLDDRIKRTEMYYRNYLYNEPGLNASFDVPDAPSLPGGPTEFFRRLDKGRRMVKDYYEGYRVLSESEIVSADVKKILERRTVGSAGSMLFEYWLPVEVAQNRAAYGKDASGRDKEAVCLAWYFALLSKHGPEGPAAPEIEDWLSKQGWLTRGAETGLPGFAELPKDLYRVGWGCQQTSK